MSAVWDPSAICFLVVHCGQLVLERKCCCVWTEAFEGTAAELTTIVMLVFSIDLNLSSFYVQLCISWYLLSWASNVLPFLPLQVENELDKHISISWVLVPKWRSWDLNQHFDMGCRCCKMYFNLTLLIWKFCTYFFFSNFSFSFNVYIMAGIHSHVSLWLGWGGSVMEESWWANVLIFFSPWVYRFAPCCQVADYISIKGWEMIIWWCLRDPDVVNSVSRELLEWFW